MGTDLIIDVRESLTYWLKELNPGTKIQLMAFMLKCTHRFNREKKSLKRVNYQYSNHVHRVNGIRKPICGTD